MNEEESQCIGVVRLVDKGSDPIFSSSNDTDILLEKYRMLENDLQDISDERDAIEEERNQLLSLSNKLQNELRKSSSKTNCSGEGRVDELHRSTQDETVESTSRQSQRNDFPSTDIPSNKSTDNAIEIEGLAKDLWSNALKGNRVSEV